ncbi:Peptide methionine sulfoxide reductase MsrA 2 [Planctomycetes bacterium Pan216]|uniref:Peptide methionine sulfoxide reductase MsrA n=1 Tax=Kolteria novifilia TaxID=2527975 RepID=A0A518AXH2_9BACT|nr:Peptide methionine sulfoxide reductase MsrA 2 [Planctomycetes bacterium Pan216]
MATQVATLGGGCFWCLEAVFLELRGVSGVVSGYTGGTVENPNYHQVCGGTTDHAEVIQVTFDPEVVSYAEILEIFFAIHDPTTLNRQGNDVGTQYRSAIFVHDDDQRATAEAIKAQLDASGTYPNPIITEIVPAPVFYPAEDYHQNYYAENSTQPYCQFVVKPKLDKFRTHFAEKRQEV